MKETEARMPMTVKRGTVSAPFFLACIAAMELEGVVLETNGVARDDHAPHLTGLSG
ncbi:DUF6471 domain-containing protein [Bradyrhizobium sp. CCBAU 11361]|uniref:DUF6471 domain-containing protein n=1 Tax=Bradyrhizobium sp. CCBAU 11361 TaxID=1630812 RepID=UPI002306B277|nr:DUF6471 domain-containing protein [Bradyrhizobium sp. CCBAU 11361]